MFFFSCCDIQRGVHLPAREFRGQLGEEVGGCPGAGMWQRAGVMVGQGGWSGWGWVHRGPAVPQLSPVKGAADCWAAGQAASVRRGGGGGGSGPRNAERGGRRCSHAVAQRAAGRTGKWLCYFIIIFRISFLYILYLHIPPISIPLV